MSLFGNNMSDKVVHFQNYSNGYIIEITEGNIKPCSSWLLLPAENLWNSGLRGFLYIIAMIYFFLGIAIASDLFMCSIEVITSKKRTIIRWDEERQERVEKKVLLWNETVANLTLMALGSSAPEILLAVIEAAIELPQPFVIKDSLGVFTIIGSAAFNLLIITAICIVSVPSPDVKKVRELGVFVLTSFWSIFAYFWMLICVAWVSPGEIEIWEAFVTLGYMPVLVLMSYAQDNGWWCKRRCQRTTGVADDAMPCPYKKAEIDGKNVRILGHNEHHHGNFNGPSKELKVLEHDRQMRLSQANLKSDGKETDSGKTSSTYVPGLGSATELLPINNSLSPPPSDSHNTGSTTKLVTTIDREVMTQDQQRSFARARFRHAAISSMLGQKKHTNRPTTPKPKILDIVDQVRSLNTYNNHMTEEDLCGKFTFAAPSYSVIESAGILEVDVLFHRKKPSQSTLKIANGGTKVSNNNTALTIENEKETSLTEVQPIDKEEDVITGVVSVDYETREGTAKLDKDFKHTQGTLVFNEKEYNKTITVPIVTDHQWEGDNEFYVILKNAKGDAGLGDPSVTRVTIIDDDGRSSIFKETEYRKSITIPIVNGQQFENDVNFYLILKNPHGDAGIGDPNITRVTIVDDDEPGEFLFERAHTYADPAKGYAVATVIRQKGCDGTVTIEYSTIDGTAKGGEDGDSKSDFIKCSGILQFKHGEASKEVTVCLNKDINVKGYKNFIIALRNPSLGAKIGEHSATVVNLSQDDIGDRIAEILADDEDEDTTWGEQIQNAMKLEADEDEDGNEIPLKWFDYVLHFMMFFWKVLLATLVPPKHLLGSWPTFVMSLLMIGGCTACVEQLGHLLGCVISLKTSVTGITIIALGTSLPDTFASRTAALQDEGADAAIGNVTGSNSVNVFLGLGLPWVMSTLYYYATGKNNGKYEVSTDNLIQSVIVFTSVGSVCIIMLLLRRTFVGGELGGKNPYFKWFCSVVLVLLWVTYIVIASLKAYDIIIWDIPV